MIRSHSRADSRADPGAMIRAIAGVLRSAQEGELPLFAWTLGLPQPALLALVQHCFPELGTLEPMPARQYVAIVDTAPAQFRDLTAMLFANRSPKARARHADWLAHAIAAACLGERHLWQDMGLTGREALSALLKSYFGPLFRRNKADLQWKRFLFAELGKTQGRPGLRPPGCERCAQAASCFPIRVAVASAVRHAGLAKSPPHPRASGTE
ncbi:MAG: nitrogen fixation protein NifQ [Burkholderiaceae bacterium]|nr:nitrogen fixation protein NifQ [Burkholderiaceae bacterium]